MLVGDKLHPVRRYRQCSVDGGGAEGIFIKSRVAVSKLVVAAVAAFARRQRCSFPFLWVSAQAK